MKAIKIARTEALLLIGALCVLVLAGCTPPGPAALLEGEALLKRGEYPAAIQKLRKATELLAEHSRAWNLLALAYHRYGEAKSAEQAYRQSLRLNPDFVVARYNFGCLLLESGKFKEAEEQFKTCEALEEGNLKVWVKLGTAQLGAGNLGEAERAYTTALKQDRAFPEAWNGLGLIRAEKKQRQNAWDYFNEAAKRNYAPAVFNQAVMAQQQRDLRLAHSKYRRFLFLNKESSLEPEVKKVMEGIAEALKPKPAVVKTLEVPRGDVDAPSTQPPAPSEHSAGMATSGTVEAREDSPAPAPVKTSPQPAKESAMAIAVTPTADSQITGGQTESAAKTIDGKSPETEKPADSGSEEVPDLAANPMDAEPKESLETAEAPAEETVEPPTVAREVVSTEADGGVRETAETEVPPALSEEERLAGEWRTVSVHRSGPGFSLASIRRQLFGTSDDAAPAESAKPLPPPQEASLEARPAVSVSQRVARVPYTYQRPALPDAGDRRKAAPHYQKGNREYRAGRASEAILAYREAVSQDPAFFEAHYNLGLSAFKAGFTADALAAYELALAIRPAHRDARYNFALALEQGRHFDEAAAELQAVIGDHPGDLDAHFTLATLYATKLGNAETARRHYEQVLALDPSYPRAVSIRYWLSAGGRY